MGRRPLYNFMSTCRGPWVNMLVEHIVPHLDTLDMVELDQVMSVGGVRKLAPLTLTRDHWHYTLSCYNWLHSIQALSRTTHHQLATLAPPVHIL